jgi:hypothetical protein
VPRFFLKCRVSWSSEITKSTGGGRRCEETLIPFREVGSRTAIGSPQSPPQHQDRLEEQKRPKPHPRAPMRRRPSTFPLCAFVLQGRMIYDALCVRCLPDKNWSAAEFIQYRR